MTSRPSGRTRPRTGRPPVVTRQQVVDAGVEIGLEGLTMQAVARHLGIGDTTVYNYLPGRDALVRAVADALVMGLEHDNDSTDPRSLLVGFGNRLRALLVGHQGLAGVLARHHEHLPAVAAYERVTCRRLETMGLDPAAAALVNAETAWYTISFVAVGALSHRPGNPEDEVAHQAMFEWALAAHTNGVMSAVESGSRP